MASDPWLGRQLGAYQILDIIGHGGMGSVYRALHPVLGRQAAIKFLRADRAGSPAMDECFLREARAIARLRHPHIIQLYDFGLRDEGYYMVLELVEGESLHQRLHRLHGAGQRIPVEHARRIVSQVADGLTHVHRQGIVHRDIKPANILLNVDGDAILTDFGIARLLVEEESTHSGDVIGTPAYVAPEQARGLPADHRADLYALAVVLYEMLAGRPPFTADNAAELLAKHIQDAPLPLRSVVPDLPPSVEQVVLRALSKSPEDRQQSVAAFQAELEQAWDSKRLPAMGQDLQGETLAPEHLPSTGRLPFLRASLVGRRAEIDSLKRRLRQAGPKPAFISLVGMGGIGKTALATAAAHEMAAEQVFPDGIVWLNGWEQTSLGAVMAELADALKLEVGQQKLAQQRRALAFHLADRKALIVLDNFETVEDGQAVAEFLAGLPVPVLVTGRQWAPGSQVIELDSLAAEAAVRLFQAASGLPEADLGQAAVELCTTDLGGHPLAIQVVGALAAAGLDVAELRDYMRQSPLEVLGETAGEAKRSVVDALRLSYHRLSGLAQAVLVRASVFAADFDLAALAALSPEHSRLQQVKALRELTERSLLAQLSRQRYRLHPVTRQFAYTLLDDATACHRRAAAHFMTEAGADWLAALEQLVCAGDVAQAAEILPDHVGEWIGSGQAARALRQVERLDTAKLDQADCLAMREAQGDLLALLGYSDKAMQAYRAALDHVVSGRQQARLERKTGELVRRQRPAEAIAWFERGLAHLNDPDCLEAARIYIRMSAAWYHQGRYERVIEWGQRGLEIARRMGESIEVVNANINLGNAYSSQATYHRAIDAYKEALAILQTEKPRQAAKEALVQSNLATTYHDQGDWEQAIAFYEQSLHTEEMLGNVDSIARVCFNLGEAYILTGEFEQADEKLGRCLALWKQAGSDYGVAAACVNLGLLYLRCGKLPEAETTLAQSRASFEAIGSNDYLPTIYGLMSETALAQNQATLAVEHARRSLELAQQMGAQMEEGTARRTLGIALAAQGQAQAGLEELTRSLAILDEVGDPYEAARTRCELGRLHLRRGGEGERAQAVAFLRKAADTFARLGAKPDSALAQAALAQAEWPDQIAATEG